MNSAVGLINPRANDYTVSNATNGLNQRHAARSLKTCDGLLEVKTLNI